MTLLQSHDDSTINIILVLLLLLLSELPVKYQNTVAVIGT